MKLAPYEIVIRVGVLVLLVSYIVRSQFPDFAPALVAGVTYVTAALVLAAAVLEVVRRVRQAKLGNFYLLRTSSLYLNVIAILFSAASIGIDLFYDVSTDWPTSLSIFAGIVGFSSQTYAYFYFDSVSLEKRFGILTQRMAVFNIDKVEQEEKRLIITPKEGREVHLRQGEFGKANFAELCTRVRALC